MQIIKSVIIFNILKAFKTDNKKADISVEKWAKE